VIRLVVGLGNPGQEYERTRHNAGFWLLEKFASGQGLHFRKDPKYQALVVRMLNNGPWLLMPQSFMNASGRAVQMLAGFFKIKPEEILVVVDDVALPLGRLRLRPSGSDGGHNGLKSIIEHLGEAFMRLRIGIGASPEADELIDHVLGKFDRSEKPTVDNALERATEAIEHLVENGMASAMSNYNRAE